MTILYLLIVINIFWGLLLSISYRKQIKTNKWLCDRLIEVLNRNTDTISELGDDVRNSRNVTINTDSFMKELNIQNHSPEDIQTIENCMINILKRAFSNMEEIK